MLIPFLISKIHRGTVSRTDIDYEGSISIDETLMESARLKTFQKVEVYVLSNGNRFSTYAIPQTPGSGEITVNGAAAKLVSPGDKVIIAAYALIEENEWSALDTVILKLNEKNEIEKISHGKA
jgi:aspartate 1-decarboxylase